MSEAGKDTIYIDVDDEITGIIDKVANAKHKIVALVLPKRASVLQSIVNMKLLKRSGDTHKKQLVLITSEAGLMPLAGAVKLHVAKTLQSKPAIPAGPKIPSDDLAVDDDDANAIDDIENLDEDEVTEDPKVDKAKTVGELAGAAAVGAKLAEDDETIELDNDVEASDTAAKAGAKTGTKTKATKGDKKLKVPNFNKFRKRTILIGAGVVALIALWLIGIFVLPKATVIIKTDNVSVNTDLVFTASTSAEELDQEKSIVPATSKEVKKTDSEKVPATGKKNVGEKATGTVTVKIAKCAPSSVSIPAGTGVSNGGLTFITQSEVNLTSFHSSIPCSNDNPAFSVFTTKTVNVVAQNPGDQYNISGGRTFSVNGFSDVSGVDSSAMSGGTNKEVTVVSDQDVETAKGKLTDKSKPAATSELEKQLEDEELFPITESLTASTAAITASPKVGDEASEVTVTSTTTYTMLGVKRDDLKKLVVKSVEDDIDTSKQKVADDGLDKAVFKLGEKASPTDQKINVQTTVSTGAQIDEAALKTEIAGKKKGDVQQIIGAYPGVKEVEVKYSPFWVYKTPKNPSKITLVFEQAEDASN
ncbi:MAG: hypothetical protein QG628_705 [Patescibacteria group bacterium]|nr:hypothetical protein [Patescibacteria group bacterium]